MSNFNVDPNEIAKFSELSAHWWDPQGELRTLHEINPLRLNYINEQVSLNSKTVVDVGCGGGILTEGMAKLGATVTGIDMSESILKVAKMHLHESAVKVDYIHSTAEQLATEKNNHFDVVTCLEMLEHVPDPKAIVDACAKLAKPGGDLFFSTLNRNMKSYLFAIVGAEYVLKMLPKNTHDYAKFIKPSELAEWARGANLHVSGMIGITYHPLTKQYKLSPDVSVNYLIHFKKLK